MEGLQGFAKWLFAGAHLAKDTNYVVKTGGCKMIQVDGKYNVWTKKICDGKIKVLCFMDDQVSYLPQVSDDHYYGRLIISFERLQRKGCFLGQPFHSSICQNLLWICNSIHLKRYCCLCQQPSVNSGTGGHINTGLS